MPCASNASVSDNFQYSFQGRTSGAQPRESDRPGTDCKRARIAGVSPLRGGCRVRLPRHRPPPVPAVTPRCRATRTGPGRHARARCTSRRAKSQPPGRNAAHCPGRPLHPQGHPKFLSNCSAKPAPQKATSGPTLPRGASADPAGLTARARPEGRPERARRTFSSESADEDGHT